ncbi:hypothetical protein BG46_11010 [Brucella anthropi]|uniref:hypothetical protein n=1 Tax=Brucella anthropi TaxID=529 RepID=UPI000450D899|nr:hypothetical protein [Brucella anthropi]EXL07425.1 hypothetical protein BG46_11010 [Brucella anthropi]RRY13333.1 hypothetical protein EGJ58_03235 [Brucella anthropi]
MAEQRKYSPNFNWALPLSQGNQIVEITQIGDTISDIDVTFKTFLDAYNAHRHTFREIEELPTTLEGYGITDAMTSEQVGSAISESGNSLGQAFTQALASLSQTIATALGLRVRVDEAQEFTLAQKKRARDNIEAVGVVDKGTAGGVAPLGTDGKIAGIYLPALTTTATVGAAMAGANSKATPADGDFFGGVLAGGSTMFKTTWANIKTTLKAYFDGLYAKVSHTHTIAQITDLAAQLNAKITTDGRAYPRRVGGAAINFNWSGKAGSPTWVWGWKSGDGTEAVEMFVYNPANFSVSYANSASNANTVGGQTLAQINAQIESRASAWAVQEGRNRTRDYLLAEHVPVGGYVFAQCRDNILTGGTVAGTRLYWASADGGAASGANTITFGTWQNCGATMAGSQANNNRPSTTLWKRIG